MDNEGVAIQCSYREEDQSVSADIHVQDTGPAGSGDRGEPAFSANTLMVHRNITGIPANVRRHTRPIGDPARSVVLVPSKRSWFASDIRLFDGRNTTYKTVMGQILDMYATVRKPGEQIDFSRFTMDRMNNIMKHKTAYYTFVLPVQAAMHFVGIKDPELFRQAQTILIEMGQYFQVRDDYLDCYGDKEVTGKNSTDIAQGKCTWLIVVALQRATQKQRKILEECYGIADEEKVNRVMQVYDEIGLQNTFSIYDQETYNLLHTHIQQISRGLPHDIFLQLLKLVSKKQMER
nr:farnesyl pyrophosphate synthase isoform X6 [Nomia melanderi]